MTAGLTENERSLLKRLGVALAAFVVTLVVGAAGYRVLGGDRWPVDDALYMTAITISTVGFGEILPGMDQVRGARAWTVALVLFGSGTLLYVGSTLTALLVEGDLTGALKRRRRLRVLADLHQHIIVCGGGSTGEHVVHELIRAKVPFVVVERDAAQMKLLELSAGHDLPHLIGDASSDHILEQAGIQRARGLIAALTEDRDNLLVTVTARLLRADLPIVTKGVHPENVRKLRLAGATEVVSPARLGGLRLVGMLLQPNTVNLMEALLRDPEQSYRLEEHRLDPKSPLAGRTLAGADLRRKTGALLVALRTPEGRLLVGPDGSQALQPGSLLITLGTVEQQAQLRALVLPR